MNEKDLKILRAVLAGYDDLGWSYWVAGKTLEIPGFGTIGVVKFDPGSATYGDDTSAVIIFELFTDFAETLYFRKFGYHDSYDDQINWFGEFRQVKPTKKTIYEYV
jgi:hypothetical protein